MRFQYRSSMDRRLAPLGLPPLYGGVAVIFIVCHWILSAPLLEVYALHGFFNCQPVGEF